MPLNWCNQTDAILHNFGVLIHVEISLPLTSMDLSFTSHTLQLTVIDGVLIIELINIGSTFVLKTHHTKI